MGFLSPLVTFLAWMIGSFVDFFTQRLYTSKIVFNRTSTNVLHHIFEVSPALHPSASWEIALKFCRRRARPTTDNSVAFSEFYGMPEPLAPQLKVYGCSVYALCMAQTSMDGEEPQKTILFVGGQLSCFAFRVRLGDSLLEPGFPPLGLALVLGQFPQRFALSPGKAHVCCPLVRVDPHGRKAMGTVLHHAGR